MNFEWLGILASISIIVGFLFSDEKKIRVADAIGCVLFIIYGIIIDSFSNVFLHIILLLIHFYHLFFRRHKNAKKRR